MRAQWKQSLVGSASVNIFGAAAALPAATATAASVFGSCTFPFSTPAFVNPFAFGSTAATSAFGFGAGAGLAFAPLVAHCSSSSLDQSIQQFQQEFAALKVAPPPESPVLSAAVRECKESFISK
jgi:hypothetical protein